MFVVITDDLLPTHMGHLVHVEGWNPAAVFTYEGEELGRHQLRTPKTRKLYHTTNRLIYTRREEETGEKLRARLEAGG